jgi:hypothetical protein
MRPNVKNKRFVDNSSQSNTRSIETRHFESLNVKIISEIGLLLPNDPFGLISSRWTNKNNAILAF